MKVSIITVCYNSAVTIEDTINSVRSQTYHNIEYIVIDGGSSDDTNQIVENHSDLVDVHISEKDDGLYDAMNKGIKMASGDVIGILNSDDFFCSETSVSDLMSGFSSENIDGVYSDLVYVEEQNTSKITRLYSSKVFKKSLIKFGLMLPHPTFYIKREAYEKYGLYKTDYRVAADFEFITRCSSGGIILNRVPKITVKMREGGISSSGLMWRIHQNVEIVRACRENGIYTNLAMVALKLPYKVFTLLIRKFVRV
ncbi:glycosyltransferase family 2 protein [Vibrio cyclitrophicus]|uniref:glycosyltransferase family 2 protein n=1 Tax=Vibrio cyclitrophicus TaxID=47951 RepID=UPI0002E8A8E9|nr:glycosyltransferase family 2 protein [Vibrio cyclitrophicus]OED68577.1 glycosyl transferase [Vibrio cyclitrophicus ZF99]OED75951.1 glycosyl transferase [Vibrio cyclitrophicus ZF65]PME20598.1 glycosyl transferase [Vibrio cyclitrophicus]PME42061.1 glycosyl transferase [Vibrio cyclitrophicus]PME46504.1 glycosyl transferase [Vibrio cyclitrophicus]